LSTGVPA